MLNEDTYLRSLIEASLDPFVTIDPDGKITDVNEATIQATGISRDQLTGTDFSDYFTDPERAKMGYEVCFKKGLVKDYELTIKHIDGSLMHVLYNATVYRNQKGAAIGVFATARDITERRRAEKALKESEEKYRLLATNTLDTIWTADLDLNVTYINDAISNLLGYTPAEIIGLNAADFTPPESMEKLRDASTELISSYHKGQITQLKIEAQHFHKDGTIIEVELRCNLLLNDAGECIGFQGRSVDITDRKKAEQAMSDSESRFKALHNATFGGIAIHDKGKILDCNYGLSEITGYEVDELIGMNGLLLISESTRETVLKNIESGYEEPYEAIGLRKNGEEYPLRLAAKNIPYKGKDVRVVEFRDITERKRAEEEHVLLMAAIEQAAEIIVITDAEGSIQYVNPAFERITGYTREEAENKGPRILLGGEQDNEFHTDMWNQLLRGEIWEGRFINRKKNGTFYTEEATISPVRDASGKVVNYVAIKADISEALVRDEQLHQAQKMESIGQLAGGVAHDFNNLLMGIMGYVELCRDELGPGHPISEWLEEISLAAHRSAAITRQLLTFARKQTITPKVIDLNSTISGMLKLLRRMIGENIDLIWIPSAIPWPVKMDPGQIDQILANLFVNARDAIDGVGKVTIETSNVTITSEEIKADEGVPPGKYVMITVADNGCGMDEHTLKNIFDPFFTTKEVGKGTGLGLSTLYGIIKQNNGFVNASSKAGEGTTFRVYLPRFISAIEAISNGGLSSVIAGGTETILLAEDEKSVREISRLFLERLGYTVLVAAKPDEALQKASEHKGTIHLLLSDVVMPGMSGPDLAEELAETHPETKHLFMSGYSANVIAEREARGEKVHFLAKPFTCENLAMKIREIMNG